MTPLRFFIGLLLLPWVALAQQPTGRFPEDNAKAVCPDTHLDLTFNGPPTVGPSGNIRIYDAADNRLVDTVDVGIPTTAQRYTIGGEPAFQQYPIIITGNTATIYPHHHVLDYNKTYYVQMDPGVVKIGEADFAGLSGNTAWVFTTKPTAPAANTTRLVVAADGTGDFATVQGAVDFVPAGEHPRVTIFIRKGVYQEIVYFDRKADITFLGEDRKETVIRYANNDRFNNRANVNELPSTSPYHRGLFFANHSTGIIVTNLTLKNSTPKGGSQAESLILTGGRNIVSHVDLSSFQDTVQFNDSTYIADCYIEGDTDYIWGRGPAYFTRCELKNLTSRAPYMQIRNTVANHGFVFVDCTFNSPPGVTGVTLARIEPGRFPYSEVVLIDCKLGSHISAAAWRLDAAPPPRGGQGGTPPSAPSTANLHFWEYNSVNLDDGKPTDVGSRAAFSKQLTKENDAETIANYRNSAHVLGWTPDLAAIPTAPAASTKP